MHTPLTCLNAQAGEALLADTMSHRTSSRYARSMALALGTARYFTGKPCQNGHIAERYVTNKQCCECNAVKSRRREAAKCKIDPSHRMYRSVQRRSGQLLKGRYSPVEALGCDRTTLREHVSKRFAIGMCWDRYGQWELDHMVPLSKAKTLTELIDLCHFTNLQPLWKRHNRIKGGS